MKVLTRHHLIPGFLAVSIGAALALSTGMASAGDRQVATERFTEYADVIDVQPVYQNIRVREPRQECWIETRQEIVGYKQERSESHRAYRSEQRHSSSGNAVVGGLIGGVIGNQLGRGHSSKSRTGATIAGAIIGGAIGNESRGSVERHRRNPPASRQQRVPIYETVETERCKEVSESKLEQRLQHYDVTYRYKGRSFSTRMKRDPGSQIELQVSVAPARNQ